MKVSIKLPLFLFLCLLLFTLKAAPPAEQYREPGPETLEQFWQDDDYSYQRQELQRPAFWTRVMSKFQDVLNWLFGAAPSGRTIQIIFYLLCVAILIWAVVRLVGVPFNSMFSREGQNKSLEFYVREEHIHEMDFPKAIAEAQKNMQWRLLIRLQYLFALKLLADKGRIEVKSGKTNHEYLYEIKEGEVRQPFERLSRIFEYTWYGHFEVNPAVLQSAGNELENLQRMSGK